MQQKNQAGGVRKNGGVRSRIVTQSHFPDIQTFVLMVALEP